MGRRGALACWWSPVGGARWCWLVGGWVVARGMDGELGVGVKGEEGEGGRAASAYIPWRCWRAGGREVKPFSQSESSRGAAPWSRGQNALDWR